MFYKILKDNRVLDVLDGLCFLKYQAKFNRFVFCDMAEAQAIRSSDGETIWHEVTLAPIPTDGYDTVRAVPIEEIEYRRLKAMHCNTLEEIIDSFVLSLLDKDVRVLHESLMRLVEDGEISLYDANCFENKIG